MANIYVRSTDGSDADNGSTWALAKATLTGAAAIDAAGDSIYLSQAHAESTASAVTIALNGTFASPTQVICANDSAAPPTAAATGASITTTGNSSITITGSAYFYGLTFNAGNSTGTASISLANTTGNLGVFDSCTFNIISTGGSSWINCGAVGQTHLKNCAFKFGAAGQRVSGNTSKVFIEGGLLSSGGTSPTVMFAPAVAGMNISGFDLSNASAGVNIFAGGTNNIRGIIRNSRLPASWSGSLASGTLTVSERYEMHNCDSGDTNYRLWVQDYAGAITTETVIVRTGGASDGATPQSWKMVTTANAEYPALQLDSPEIVQWIETTGSAITATVEVVTDNVTLTDAECWLEVQYLGTSGFPLGSFITDAKADVLATAANQTSSSVTWTTTGLGTPVKQKLSVTFTPQEKGFIHAVVKVAQASTTVYVDPLLTIT